MLSNVFRRFPALALAAAVALSTLALGAQAQQPAQPRPAQPTTGARPAQGAPTAYYFMVQFAPGQRWDRSKPADQQAGFREHQQFLQTMRQQGRLLLGGRYAGRGMFILIGTSEQEIRQIVGTDPIVRSGVMAFEAFPFQVTYPGFVGPRQQQAQGQQPTGR
jgi:uncharacterized protein YciI